MRNGRKRFGQASLLVALTILSFWLFLRPHFMSVPVRPGPAPSGSSPAVARNQSKPVVLAQADQPSLTTIFPPAEMPVVATETGARVSLQYLAENGADLAKPMPSKHRVFAASAQIAAQVASWARANGFEVRGPVLSRSHIGEPQQSLELVRTEVPDPAQIEREGRAILAEVQRTPGTFYQTWCGEIVR